MQDQLSSKTRQEVADEYGISRRTLYNWLKKAGIKADASRFSPLILRKIYTVYGWPKESKRR